MDKNLDNGMDKVECEICHRVFKKRGINIHLTRSKCGKPEVTSPEAQRIYSKSEDILTQESHHSGKEIQGRRRKSFTVSQIYHRRKKTDAEKNRILESQMRKQ